MTQHDFTTVRGDTFSSTLTIRDAGGTVINVSTWSLLGQIRSGPESSAVVGSFSFDMASAATGVVVASISAALMAAFPIGVLCYDIQATLPGSVVATIMQGLFSVTPDVSRA